MIRVLFHIKWFFVFLYRIAKYRLGFQVNIPWGYRDTYIYKKGILKIDRKGREYYNAKVIMVGCPVEKVIKKPRNKQKQPHDVFDIYQN